MTCPSRLPPAELKGCRILAVVGVVYLLSLTRRARSGNSTSHGTSSAELSRRARSMQKMNGDHVDDNERQRWERLRRALLSIVAQFREDDPQGQYTLDIRIISRAQIPKIA